MTQGRWGGVRDLDPAGVGRSEAAANMEVIDGGQGAIHRGRPTLQDGLEVGAVVAHGPVASVGAVERVSVGLGAVEPGQVLADLGGVGAPGLVGQGRPGQGGDVGLEHIHRRPGQLDGNPPKATPLDGKHVL